MSTNAPLRSLYVTLVDFFEHSQQQIEHLPVAIDPNNIDIHRQLVAAIESGDEDELLAATRRHDENRLALGLFRSRHRH
jgi:DNA-binding FadR family transcriptional regulator